MTDYPPVIVLIITYRRLDLAIQTIRSVKTFLDYPNVGFHIADDGSGQDYINTLCKEIGGSYSITITDAERGGVGKNMNLGIAGCLSRADLWLHLEDDWVLRQPLNLTSCVQLMSEDETIGMVRLGRMAGGITAESIGGANKLWWKLVKGSDTYVFSGNAALRHRRFFDAYGPYIEGLPPGQNELWYCNRFNSLNGPSIVWPAWLSTGQTFFHIGDSQSFKWWMETGGVSAEEAADKFNANAE